MLGVFFGALAGGQWVVGNHDWAIVWFVLAAVTAR